MEGGDGDLMGDGVNIATRLEGVNEPGSVCPRGRLSRVKERLDLAVMDLGQTQLQAVAEPIKSLFAAGVGVPAQAETRHGGEA